MEGAEKPESTPPAAPVGRLTGSAALRAHLTLGVGLMLCALAFWIELHRAEGGNSLSWAYVFEWPLLGGFAIYMWWKILHPEVTDGSRTKTKKEPALAPEYSGMLAAWEEHQRELSAQRQKESTSSTAREEEEWS